MGSEMCIRDSKRSMNEAYKKVRANKGAGGVDGMEIEELAGYIRKNCDSIREQIRKELYHPHQKKASKV